MNRNSKTLKPPPEQLQAVPPTKIDKLLPRETLEYKRQTKGW